LSPARNRHDRPPTILLATFAAFYPAQRGDSRRMEELVTLFGAHGWRVLVVHCHDSIHRGADYSAMAERCDDLVVCFPDRRLRGRAAVLGCPNVDEWCPDVFARTVAAVAARERVDVVYTHLVFNSKCFALLDDGVPPLRLLDADNLFSRRSQLFAEAGLPYAWLAPTREQEAMALRRSDVIIAVQETEAGELRRMVPERTVMMLPGFQPVIELGPGQGELLAFVGNDSVQNVAGIRQFIFESMPIIRARFPSVRLCVAGRVCEQLGPVPGWVESLGTMTDLTELYR
jgi:hypothetical protein